MTTLNTVEFLSHLRSLNIKIWADGDRLRYSAPPGALTPDLSSQLVAHKAEILALIQQAQATTGSTIPVTPRTDNLPLSFGQQRLWFLHQLQPHSPAYNIPVATRLLGPLNVNALRQSLQHIIRRHESLRTTFSMIGDQPVQIIAPPTVANTVPLEIVDIPAADIEARIQTESWRPFNLSTGPLLKTTLFRLNEAEHILLVVFHHIVFDGWSMQVFCSNLAVLYDAYLHNRQPDLSPLPIQYADFAGWERERFESVGGQTLAYWKNQLGDELPVLQLPTDFPRPPVQQFRGATEFFSLPQPLTERLNTLSRRHESTLFITLMTAFNVLLYRYSGQGDILVGFPAANRIRTEFESLIGFFVNTLVLRTDLAGNPSFEKLLSRVRNAMLQAYAHQEIPFEKLVEKLQPERDLSRQPLFQIMFDLQSEAFPQISLSGVTSQPQPVQNEITKFDLTVEMIENETGLTGSFEYDTDLFSAGTIRRMIAHFQVLLEGIVSNPAQQLSQLPLLTPAEQQQILVEWNNTHIELPTGQCAHHLFEAQVQRTPNAIAIKSADPPTQITYAELNHRANQLAHALQKINVGPDVLVGLCVERSVEMVVAVLAILKAGGAYLPLDPTYPKERLAFMLADSRVPVLLTQSHLLDKLPPQTAQVICLDSERKEMRGGEETRKQGSEDAANLVASSPHNSARLFLPNPTGNATPQNLAYVIYTSGSTGQPKGVEILHRGLVNHNLAVIGEYGLQATDRVLQFASIGFDTAAEEVFPTLLSGATLVLRTDAVLVSFAELVRFVERHRLTVLNLPTAYWHQWTSELAEANLEALASLRLVVVGGEAAFAEQLSAWQAQVGSRIKWVNTYGPTETTIIVTSFWPDDGGSTPRRWHTVPIGRPLQNTQIYVLDAHLNPVPVGVSGEIYIGGAGVARGYLNQPDLTGERFVPNPFLKLKTTLTSQTPNSKLRTLNSEPETLNSKLYKSGDLGRYLPDGNVEYLGRTDNQVKLRGFRIELGEIETRLVQHPAIKEAVVLARKDDGGYQQLMAYVACLYPLPDLTSVLRNYLTQTLPDYMIPSIFVTLNNFPLTANGKVNRRALPVPDVSRPELLSGYVAPRNALENEIVDIWAAVLGLERIGVNDNFFELGGHSLQIIQLIYRIKRAFGVELSLREFFAGATVANLAGVIGVSQHPTSNLDVKPPIDLEAEAVLEPAIWPKKPAVWVSQPQTIFLTGVTGFLGTNLLADLLAQTRADIYCLVRASTVETGYHRIREKLKAALLWNDSYRHRIKAVPGDLSQPRLGLSVEQFQVLAETVNVIYHNGAAVNLVLPYQNLKPANVQGTQEVLWLATLARTIPVHYVSTLAVFDSIGYFYGSPINEVEIPGHSNGLFNGYAESKWVAERLVLEAKNRGLPVSIYRPGLIVGHTQTGAWQTGDYFTRFVKGCVQLGSMPNLEIQWQMAPVDYVSQAITSLARQPECLGKTFHIDGVHSFTTEDLANVLRTMGYALKHLPYATWRNSLSQASEHNPEQSLYPLLPIFFEPILDDGTTLPEMYTSDKEPTFNDDNLKNGLAGSGIIQPVIDREMLINWFKQFVTDGFLPPPP